MEDQGHLVEEEVEVPAGEPDILSDEEIESFRVCVCLCAHACICVCMCIIIPLPSSPKLRNFRRPKETP